MFGLVGSVYGIPERRIGRLEQDLVAGFAHADLPIVTLPRCLVPAAVPSPYWPDEKIVPDTYEPDRYRRARRAVKTARLDEQVVGFTDFGKPVIRPARHVNASSRAAM
jgi:hypothetical protein